METWFREQYRDTEKGFKVLGALHQSVSQFQTMDVLETAHYGRLLVLDGTVQTTEGDEFIYHELIAHIPLLAHPAPKQVLVIGGGDGGTVREVLKHPGVERVVLCEIDGDVIDVCRKYLPSISCALDEPRVEIVVGDGVAYVEQHPDTFDVILNDSTDPAGPGVGLFTEGFYQNVKRALKKDGIFSAQTESPFADPEGVQKIYTLLRKVFPITQAYVAPIPTYPAGYWSWSFCSETLKPMAHVREAEARRLEKDTRYYNWEVHQAVWALPNFVKALVSTESPASTVC